MNTPALVLRLTAACALALVVAGPATLPLVRTVQPALVRLVAAAAPDLRVLHAGVLQRGGPQLVVMAAQQRTLLVDGRALPAPDPPAPVVASLAAGSVLQASLVALVLAAAWPARRRIEWALRVPLAAGLVPLLLALDAPLALAGLLEAALHQQLGSGARPALAAWNHFLVAGGRLALGVAGGLAVVAGARALLPTARAQPR